MDDGTLLLTLGDGFSYRDDAQKLSRAGIVLISRMGSPVESRMLCILLRHLDWICLESKEN